MFGFFKKFRKKAIEKDKGLSTEDFKKLAQDIRNLANLIEKIWVTNSEFQQKIKKIKKEMDNLEKIINQQYFSDLSENQKHKLKKSLLISKKELLKCVQEAPCPTERIQ